MVRVNNVSEKVTTFQLREEFGQHFVLEIGKNPSTLQQFNVMCSEKLHFLKHCCV